MEPLDPEIFQNGIWYELRGEQYYPCLLPPEPDHTEEELLKTIIRQMAKAHGVDEDLKERDPLAWVGAMNKKIIPIRTMKYERANRRTFGHIQTIEYTATLNI